MAKKTLRDLDDLFGKRVLVRVDFNVPLDSAGNITNDRRIQAALSSLRYLIDAGSAPIVMSHLGRPKGDPHKDLPFKMDRVAQRLRELLGSPVTKVDQVIGNEAEQAAGALKPGEVLVLENLRFHPGEQSGDPDFARQLARLGDVYVNDAFGTCHRSDASMVAVPQAMSANPRVVGFLVAKELEILGQLLSSPPKPLIAILGGAKVSDKIGFIKSLMPRVDRFLIGGAMTYTFLLAKGGKVGSSRVEADKLDIARELLALGASKIVLPVDHLIVEKLDNPEGRRVVDDAIPNGWIGVDIGPKTIDRYRDEARKAKMIVWNGPLGKYEDEPYSEGTRQMAQTLAESNAITVVGGGETAEAVEGFALADRMSHVSTGGGAFLEYVEGTPFPALAQIEDKSA